MRALRDISDQLSDRSGVVVHEVVADGSIWYGKDLRELDPATENTVKYFFNTDEIVKFPARGGADLALDGRRPLPRRDARLHAAQPRVRAHAARRGPGRLARGQRQRRAARHGRGEARQRRLLHPRAVRLRRHGAVGRPDGGRRRGRGARRRSAPRASRTPGGCEAEGAYADSLDNPGDVKTNQKHWIGADPMEAELYVDGEFVPGLASFEHGTVGARHARDQLLQRRAARQPRPVPHGLRRRSERRGRVRHLLAQQRHHGRRRGQLRPPRRRAAGSATRAPTPRRSSRSRSPATRPTSSRARCRRSSRR